MGTVKSYLVIIPTRAKVDNIHITVQCGVMTTYDVDTRIQNPDPNHFRCEGAHKCASCLVNAYEPLTELRNLAIKREKAEKAVAEYETEMAKLTAAITYSSSTPYGTNNTVALIWGKTTNGITAILKRYNLFRANPERQIVGIINAVKRGTHIPADSIAMLRDAAETNPKAAAALQTLQQNGHAA